MDMATSAEYAAFVCEQIAPYGQVRSRKMFGEYMVYLEDKPVLLVCDNTVYVKKLFVSRPDRALIRARAAQTALELALRLAQGKVPADTQALAKSARHDAAALTALDSTFLKG